MLDILERPRRGSSGEDIYRAKAKKASNDLLGRLRRFHAEVMQTIETETVETVETAIETVEPVEPQAIESAPVNVNEPADTIKQWVERQKAIPIEKARWFSVEKDLGAVAPRAIRIDEIIEACAYHYRALVCDIRSARRTASVVRPRQVAAYLSKTLTHKSLPEIGRRMGNRDHTTILHSVRKIDRLRKTDARLESDLHAIAAMVGGTLG